MTDRPIIFSGAMVRALWAGRKTQTRRLIKPQPEWDAEVGTTRNDNGPLFWPIGSLGQQCGVPLPKARIRYAPGDRLYVRENWKPHSTFAGMKPREIPQSKVFYQADKRYAPSNTPWVPCIHMPRWASRITLFVSDVRVERLKSISEADAIAEGTRCHVCGTGAVDGSSENDCACFHSRASAVPSYQVLWNSLHGPTGWDDNPWVVVIQFSVKHGNIDQ